VSFTRICYSRRGSVGEIYRPSDRDHMRVVGFPPLLFSAVQMCDPKDRHVRVDSRTGHGQFRLRFQSTPRPHTLPALDAIVVPYTYPVWIIGTGLAFKKWRPIEFHVRFFEWGVWFFLAILAMQLNFLALIEKCRSTADVLDATGCRQCRACYSITHTHEQLRSRFILFFSFLVSRF
jgi:hypothetical protein